MTNNEITAAYYGVNPVDKIYLGDELVWPTTPPLPTEIVCTYSVASTSTAVRIAGNITSRYIATLEDGTEIPLPAVAGWKDYNFPATGQQKVTFTSKDTRSNIPSFNGCSKLVDIYIPDGYNYVGMSAFESCTGLTSVTVPNSVTAITDGSNFAYCNRIRWVDIGTGITKLGDQVFYGCTNLSAVTINTSTPPTIGNNVLQAVRDAYFYVPDEAVAAYKAAPTWSNYANRVKGISERPPKAL